MYYHQVISVLLVMILFSISGTSFSESPRQGPSVQFDHGPLKVSDNQRFLVHEDGTPFYYLGDTAWELFHRLDREDAELYLENRRQKGFTVIQAVVLAEQDGLHTPNVYGDIPLIDDEPAKPGEEYFKHVDFIVNTARDKGIYIGMLPTWGDKVDQRWGVGPVIFTNENLEETFQYGKFLGERYKDSPNIIWILGGDRPGEGYEQVWDAMARGIREGDGGRHLITYHPMGGNHSSQWFHNEEWLDFNMIQSGHGRVNNPNYVMIQRDYNREPAKPVLDGEPNYEDHPINWNAENGWFDDYDVRKACYWSLFAGSFGHTYGAHPVWQMYEPKYQQASPTRHTWKEVLDLDGAWDMMHARHLMESRPFLDRIPDQSLIVSGQGKEGKHVQATRGQDYAFIYFPTTQEVTVRLGTISGERVKAWWFDPRTGKAEEIGTFPNEGSRAFRPPQSPERQNDWVLVLDDTAREYSAPGEL
jgi:hypothetical protein